MVHFSTSIIDGLSHFHNVPVHVPLLRESVKQCQSIHRLFWQLTALFVDQRIVQIPWPTTHGDLWHGIIESLRSAQALTTCVGAVSTAWKAAWHKPQCEAQDFPRGHSKTSESVELQGHCKNDETIAFPNKSCASSCFSFQLPRITFSLRICWTCNLHEFLRHWLFSNAMEWSLS